MWEYNLAGELINVPDAETFPQGAPCDKLSIVELPCDTWGNWVWFSLNQDVEPLRDFLGIIPEHLDPYHFERMALVNDVTVEWDCNWKASVDAFNETYHVAGTHPQLLDYIEDMDVQIDTYERHNRYLIPFGMISTHIEDGATIADGQLEFMQMCGVDPSEYTGDGLGVRRYIQKKVRENAEKQGLDYSDLNDDQLSDDYHYLIFPNITFNTHCNSVMEFRQRPHETDPKQDVLRPAELHADPGRGSVAGAAGPSAVRVRRRVDRRGAGPGRIKPRDGAARHELRRLSRAVDRRPRAAHSPLPQNPG